MGRLSLVVLFLLPSHLLAEPPASQPGPSQQLAEQQRVIRERMARLEDKMFQLSKVLARTEPKQAERLQDAFKEARARLLQSRMDGVANMLEKSKLSDAIEEQQKVLSDLEALLRVLAEETSDADKRQREIERLQAFQKRLNKIIDDQSREKQDAEQSAKLKERLNQLQKTAENVANLLKRQDAAATRNADKAQESPEQGKAASQEQRDIRQETQKTSDELKAADARNNAAKSDEDNQGEKSGGESKTASDLEKAGDKMKQAEGALERGQRGEAKPPQEESAKHLRSALQRLEKEIKDLERKLDLDPQAREQKKTTDATRKLADDMSGQKDSSGEQQQSGKQQDRQKDGQQQGGDQQKQGQPLQGEQQKGDQQQGGEPQQGEQQQGQQPPGDQQQQPDGQPGGQQGGSCPSEPGQPEQTPGEQNLKDAPPFQQDAEKNLDKKDPKKAAEKQQKALEKLQKAREDLETALEQLRREQQEELLAALEARFNAMLSRQIEINRVTQRLDATGRSSWSRADQLDLAATTENERWVGSEAEKAVRILKEEGTTVVFPEVLTTVRDDANEVADRLGNADTGPAVRMLENDIVETLKEMLDAVKEKRKKNEEQEQQDSENNNNDQNPPLLPSSAELKMLRSCQLRVNRATTLLEESRAAPQTDLQQLDRDLARTAKRQADVATLAKSIEESRAQQDADPKP